VLYGVWNAVNDPWAGQLSDRTRTRWGRRRPWIAALTAPLALCFVLLWTPPGWEGLPLFWYFLLVVLVFDTLWTFVVMNWTALFPEMYPDNDERAEVSGWRQLFSIVGLILGIALTPVVVDMIGWVGMGIVFGVITGISLLASLLGSAEHPKFSTDSPLPFSQALKATLVNRSFRWFLTTNLLIQFVFLMLAATVPFYAKYVLMIQSPINLEVLGGGLELDPGLQTSLLLGTIFLISIPMLYVWTKIAQRYGARNALIAACLVFAAALTPLLFANNFRSGLIAMAFAGIGFAGLLMLTDLLIADVVDEDELTTGLRREGMFFGMNGFIIRFAYSAQGLILGNMLTFTGYVAPTDLVPNPVQPPSAVMGLRFLMAGVPMLALLLAAAAAYVYPLHGRRLAQVKSEVAGRHAVRDETGAAA
jgi:GPH family glycoside/pentoside/hexuronide:cation symporter